jgi:hypothetical protein
LQAPPAVRAGRPSGVPARPGVKADSGLVIMANRSVFVCAVHGKMYENWPCLFMHFGYSISAKEI